MHLHVFQKNLKVEVYINLEYSVEELSMLQLLGDSLHSDDEWLRAPHL